MTAHRCIAGKGCRNAEQVDDPTTGQTTRLGAAIAAETGLCDSCAAGVAYAVDDMVETWLALHVAIGDPARQSGQRVSTTKAAPVNINTEADALKVALVEWISTAAVRVAERMNMRSHHVNEDGTERYVGPEPQNSTDSENLRAIVAAVRILGPNIDRLLDLPTDDVTVWLTAKESDRAGESIPCLSPHSRTGYRPNTRDEPMSGPQLALKLVEVRRKARSFLGVTNSKDKLTLPCWRCNKPELTRRHEVRGDMVIDQVDCAACEKSWPYEQYQNIIAIRVREDEMERDKLQKQLDAERQRRVFLEQLLAEREYQIGLALECTDIPASVWAHEVLLHAPAGELMTDKDIAVIVGVSDATIRSWAARGRIDRHTQPDGSVRFDAREVWDHAHREQAGSDCA